MTKQVFESFIGKYAKVIAEIRDSAHKLHESVNHTYDDVHPYGYHPLDLQSKKQRQRNNPYLCKS